VEKAATVEPAALAVVEVRQFIVATTSPAPVAMVETGHMVAAVVAAVAVMETTGVEMSGLTREVLAETVENMVAVAVPVPEQQTHRAD